MMKDNKLFLVSVNNTLTVVDTEMMNKLNDAIDNTQMDDVLIVIQDIWGTRSTMTLTKKSILYARAFPE